MKQIPKEAFPNARKMEVSGTRGWQPGRPLGPRPGLLAEGSGRYFSITSEG